MDIHLSPVEARVIGCLIEKAITTPDQYPLSLNALTNACNQKSNRDPVLDLDERTVQETIDALVKKHLVLEKVRVRQPRTEIPAPLLQHRLRHARVLAAGDGHRVRVVAARPQTPGELRSRASRMAQIHDVGEVETASRISATPTRRSVHRAPGARARPREARYAHLFSGAPAEVSSEPETEQKAPRIAPSGSLEGRPGSLEDRIERLESVVAELQAEVDRLKGGDS